MLRIDAQKLNTHSRFLFSMTPLPGASLPLMLVHVRLPLSPPASSPAACCTAFSHYLTRPRRHFHL
jgi:hypothetical protein